MKKNLRFTYALFLFSPMRKAFERKDCYAPTNHPTFSADSPKEAQRLGNEYACRTLKLEENLKGNAQGKGKFELRLV